MELRHIRYFIAVAEELHFTRAAAKLHIAQPPLSQQILQLERELGVKLFVRSRGGVRLTDAGVVFLERARRVMEAIDDALASAQEAGRGEVGRLVIGVGGSAALEILPDVVGVHRSRFPGVKIELRELSTEAQIQGLLDHTLHVGLLRDRTIDRRLDVEVLRREPLVVLLPEGHRLAARRTVAMRDLASEPFVLAPSGQSTSYTDVVLGACAQAGFTPRVLQEASETLTILAMVAGGIGVSLLPASVEGLGARGVVYRPLRASGVTVELVAAWRKDDTSPLVVRFLDTCREAISR